MMRAFFSVVLFLALAGATVQAVENVPTSSYNEAPPASGAIANWDVGWTQPAVQPSGYTSTTGWNYVGSVNGNSGTYLGNGWVLTAAHVTLGPFALGGSMYPMVPNSARQIGNTHLMLFQVSPYPSLPPLPLRATNPSAYISQAAIVGYGHADSMRSETWGLNTVTQINESITPGGSSYVSNAFLTLTGASSIGIHSAANSYQTLTGDSGGAAFIFNSSSQRWELAGINEVSGSILYKDGTSQDFSGIIQVNTYASQIQQTIDASMIHDTPALPSWALAALAMMLVVLAGNSRRAKAVEESMQ